MSAPGEIEQLVSEESDCRDRVALLRAKLYRWGLRPSPRLQALELDLRRAQRRLRDARLRQRT